MPVDWAKYPANWKDIATAIKEATGWKCQDCGKQCYRPGEPVSNTQDVLTVAHINHVESDCRPENLVAACAVCHCGTMASAEDGSSWHSIASKRKNGTFYFDTRGHGIAPRVPPVGRSCRRAGTMGGSKCSQSGTVWRGFCLQQMNCAIKLMASPGHGEAAANPPSRTSPPGSKVDYDN